MLSGLIVGPLVSRFGAVNVMVWTHLPSNVLNIFVPLMMSKEAAVLVLLMRFSISQMDVPARQAFVVQCVSSGMQRAAGRHGVRGASSLLPSVCLRVLVCVVCVCVCLLQLDE